MNILAIQLVAAIALNSIFLLLRNTSISSKAIHTVKEHILTGSTASLEDLFSYRYPSMDHFNAFIVVKLKSITLSHVPGKHQFILTLNLSLGSSLVHIQTNAIINLFKMHILILSQLQLCDIVLYF